MAFEDHNRASLIHSPDPQVKPGWKQFGWGHGSLWGGIAEPIDAIGLGGNAPVAESLRLKLDLPTEVVFGEVVFATATVTNEDSVPRRVSAALNLAERDLRLMVIPPNGQLIEVNDVVLACSERRLVELKPGEARSGTFQLFYTNRSFTFDQPGRYVIRAELETGEGDGSVIRSDSVQVFVRPPVSDAEREVASLTMDKDVGLSLAFGDFGADINVQEKLTTLMERYGDTDTGTAAALVLANALSRDFRDLRTNRKLREADHAKADRALDVASRGRDAVSLAKYATAVISPRELTAPLLDLVQKRQTKAPKGAFVKDDLDQARKVFSDFVG